MHGGRRECPFVLLGCEFSLTNDQRHLKTLFIKNLLPCTVKKKKFSVWQKCSYWFRPDLEYFIVVQKHLWTPTYIASQEFYIHSDLLLASNSQLISLVFRLSIPRTFFKCQNWDLSHKNNMLKNPKGSTIMQTFKLLLLGA